jgi:hypothetical protein
LFTLDNIYQFIDIVKAIVTIQIVSTIFSLYYTLSDLLIKSLIFQTSLLSITLKYLKQLFIKVIQSKDLAKVSDSIKSDIKLRD